MNERIKELIAESTWVQFAEGVGYKEVFDKEKFAELIINECGVALKPMLRDMISRGKGVALIREHFGVK